LIPEAELLDHRGGDLMIPLDWQQVVATGHVLAACSALIVGAAVLLLPKGTHSHQ
jgi:hypothetical protein